MITKPNILSVFSSVVLVVVISTFSIGLTASTSEWSEPFNLSGWQEDLASIHYLEMSEDGRQVAFWIGYKPNYEWSIWTRVRSPNGNWEPAHNVTGWLEPIQANFPTFWYYDVGMTPAGEAWVVWTEQESQQPGDNIWVKGASCAPQECTWQVENVSDWPEGFIYDVDLSTGLEGQLAASWVACASYPSSGVPCAVYVKRRSSDAINWGSIERLDGSLGTAIWNVETLVGPGGLTFVQWLGSNPANLNTTGLFGRTYMPALDTWDGSDYTPLSGWEVGVSPSDPVMDPSGTVIIAWRESILSPYSECSYSRTRPSASGTWSTPTKISQDNEGQVPPILTVGNNGTALATFFKQKPGSPGEYAVFATARDAGSTWESETQLSDWFEIIHDTNTAIGVWPDGTCIVIWNMLDESRDPNQDEAIFWNTRPPAGSWAGQGRLSHWYNSTDTPNLGLGLDGSAVILWATRDAYRPANQQVAIMAIHYSPDSSWTDEINISDWDSYSVMLSTGLAIHPTGQRVGAMWYQSRSAEEHGFFYSQYSTEDVGRNIVYLPMVGR